MSKTTYNEGIMIYRSRGLNLNIPSVVRFFTACYLRYAMMHCITCMWPAWQAMPRSSVTQHSRSPAITTRREDIKRCLSGIA
jgi:hypothetical protein